MKLFHLACDENICEGPLFKKLLKFIFPLMITNLLQVCYSAADMVIVSFSKVSGALGSIGTTAAMINFIVNVYLGFSVGTNVVVARNIGANDKEKTEKSVHTSVIIAIVFGVLGTVIGVTMSQTILSALGDQGEVLRLATIYARIYFLGSIFMSLTNYLIAILRAKGDTKTPFYILTLTGILNIILNLFFVFVCDMSVEGVAIATVIANVASTVLLFLKLSREEGFCRFELSKLKLDKTAAKEIIREGFPAGIQGALFSLSNMIIQSSVIGLNNELCAGGSDIIDGNTAAHSLEGFIYTATNSVYSAAVTFTSQHFGAKKYKRIGKVMAECYLITGIIAIIFSMAMVIFHDPLIRIYVSSPVAVETAYIRMKIMFIPYFTLAFMEVGSGILRGLGRSVTSTTVSFIGSCVLRILWINTVFIHFHTLNSIYFSYPVSWIVTALVHFIFSVCIRKKYMQSQQNVLLETT